MRVGRNGKGKLACERQTFLLTHCHYGTPWNITQRRWARRNFYHWQAKGKQPISFGWVWMRPRWEKFQFWQPRILHFSAVFALFLGVKETIVGSPLFCGVGIVLCLLNLLYDHVIWWLHQSATPRNYQFLSNQAKKWYEFNNVNATSFTHICFF